MLQAFSDGCLRCIAERNMEKEVYHGVSAMY